MDTTDQTVFLFKKSLGYANTNTTTGVNVEAYTSPVNAFAENIATQSIPASDLTSSLVSDGTWTGTGTKQKSSTQPHIAKYNNVVLSSITDCP